MLQKTSTRLLFSLAFAAACFAPAYAADVSSALQELSRTDRAFHSRTCGLVLLSDGRAQTRVAKSQNTNALEPAMAQLVKAFLLLRDGRALQGGLSAPREYFAERLSTGRSTKPFNQALPEATAHCGQWFDVRRGQPDFDLGDEAKADAAAQAELTLRSE